jgi:hypothetical protein
MLVLVGLGGRLRRVGHQETDGDDDAALLRSLLLSALILQADPQATAPIVRLASSGCN